MTGVEIAFRIAVFLPLGLVFGSFLTVLIHRVPEGESVLRPRSRCPWCGTPLRAVDNIPVVSWLALRGRCHSCSAKISAVYPLTELATGALYVAVALRYEDWWVAAMLAPFTGILVALAIIDARTKRLPNRILYPSIVTAAVYLAVARLFGGEVDLLDAAIGFLAYGGGLLIVALVAPRGMGMGDVKLVAFIGVVLGAVALESVAVAAGLGILFGGLGAIAALLRGAGRKHALPFGPFLAAGAIAAVFVGPQIADLYVGLFT